MPEMTKLILTLVLTLLLAAGCAPLARMDADLARLEQPGPALECVKFLMGVEVDMADPTIEWFNYRWPNAQGVLVNGSADAETNTIYIFRHYQASRTVAHETTHLVQAYLGEEFNEWEAKKVGDWLHDCPNFM